MVLSISRHVMRELGVGHSERVYHNAMLAHLDRANVTCRSEVVCPVMYLGRCVGTGQADLVLGNTVIELKASGLPSSHALPQLRRYIRSLNELEKKKYSGVVINFNQRTGKVEHVLDPPEEFGIK
jgi:GxxExxY protein